MTRKELAAMIDHTQLKPFATPDMIAQACRDAAEAGCAALAINGCNVAQCVKLLAGTGVKVCAGAGFPLGAATTAVKVFEASEAVKNGAEELDMLINIGALKAKNTDYVRDEIKAIIKEAKGRIVKVIIETCYLTDEEKVTACKLAAEAGADFVKTSTGLGTGGATPHDVALIRASLPPRMKVKASGGMHSWPEVKANIEAGADRIGISATVKVLDEFDAANS